LDASLAPNQQPVTQEPDFGGLPIATPAQGTSSTWHPHSSSTGQALMLAGWPSSVPRRSIRKRPEAVKPNSWFKQDKLQVPFAHVTW